jgi:hypothetical protein
MRGRQNKGWVPLVERQRHQADQDEQRQQSERTKQANLRQPTADGTGPRPREQQQADQREGQQQDEQERPHEVRLGERSCSRHPVTVGAFLGGAPRREPALASLCGPVALVRRGFGAERNRCRDRRAS